MIGKKLASLSLDEAPVVGAFNPKKSDLILAQFSADNSWNRAMIVNVPHGGVVRSTTDQFDVFYIDYGNQEDFNAELSLQEVHFGYMLVSPPSLD
ncbi:hypothetical protein V2J09_001156 [Rumex salicifolius]